MATGCSAPAEQPLLERFFSASRLRDRTALQAFSTVIFEPHDDGIVTIFKITAVSPEQPSGDGVTKHVTLTAPVKLASGEVVPKTLVVTMKRRDRGWLITGVAAYQR